MAGETSKKVLFPSDTPSLPGELPELKRKGGGGEGGGEEGGEEGGGEGGEEGGEGGGEEGGEEEGGGGSLRERG